MRSAYELPDGGAGIGQREPPQPAVKVWDFDVQKLRALMEKARQAEAVLRDFSDRRRELSNDLSRARGVASTARDYFGHEPAPSTLERISDLEDALRQLDAERETAIATLQPSIELARTCESWARARGWPGRPRGTQQPPAVTGTAEQEGATAARNALFSGRR